jgi:hypothetical protein
MPLRIDDDTMVLDIDGRTVATARFSQHRAANGRGAWIVSDRPLRLFSRNQAITAHTITELLAMGYSSDQPLVLAYEEELRWTASSG